jgi:hypothetical protein
MSIQTFITLLCLILIIGCRDPCYYNNYRNITNYNINPQITLKSGIKVDDPENELDLIYLNKLTNELEKCSNLNIKRECLTIKVPPDWKISTCSGEEIFPCNMPVKVCEDKDLILTEDCPCSCRAIIQHENTIIVTPNLKLYNAELIRMITGENNPWLLDIKHCY